MHLNGMRIGGGNKRAREGGREKVAGGGREREEDELERSELSTCA